MVVQTDLAGNASTPLNFQWIRNTVVPTAPSITSPTSSPHYSNQSTFLISGSCGTGNQVKLTGNDTQDVSCTASSFSFTVAKNVDGNYPFQILQTSSANLSSPPVTIVWDRDTVAPMAPSIVSPATHPYISADTTFTLTGSCENNSIVTLSGASSQTIMNIGLLQLRYFV